MTGFVLAHLMNGIVDGVKVQFFGLGCEVLFSLAGPVFG